MDLNDEKMGENEFFKKITIFDFVILQNSLWVQ